MTAIHSANLDVPCDRRVFLKGALVGVAQAAFMPLPGSSAPSDSPKPTTLQPTSRIEVSFAWCLDFSPDGRLLAIGKARRPRTTSFVELWDCAHNRLVANLEGHRDSVRSVSFLGDGKELVTSGSDMSVRVWDVPRAKLKATLDTSPSHAHSLLVLPDNKRVVLGENTYSLSVWSLESHGCIARMPSRVPIIASIALSPDGKKFATGGSASRIDIWDATSYTIDQSFDITDSRENSVVFSTEKQTLITGGIDGRIRFWDIRTGAQTAEMPKCGLISDIKTNARQGIVITAASTGPVKALRGTRDLFTFALPTDFADPKRGRDEERCNAVAISSDGRKLAVAITRAVLMFDIPQQ